MGVSKYNTDVIKYGDPQNTPPGGGLAASVQTSNYTITEDEDVGVDSTGGTFTVTLKASPEAGDVAIIRDVGQNCGTTNVAIARNGSTINGAAADENLDVDNGMYMFVYNGTTWKFTPFSGPGLNEAEVIAVTTGEVRRFLRPTVELTRTSAAENAAYGPATYWAYPAFTLNDASDLNAFSWVDLLPENYDGGGFSVRFYWVGSSTNTGALQFSWAYLPEMAAGETYNTTPESSGSTTSAHCGVINGLNVSSWVDVSTPNWVYGQISNLWARRTGTSGSDTFTGTGYLIGMELQYTINNPTDG